MGEGRRDGPADCGDEQSQAAELDETATTQGETLKLCLHSSSLASKGH